MYRFYFKCGNDSFMLPASPSYFKIKIGSRNEKAEVIKLGEVGVIKTASLREMDFEFILSRNGFWQGGYGTYEPLHYLNKLRSFKNSGQPITFIVIRLLPDGKRSFDTNILATIEDYTVLENAGEDGDFKVTMTLREFVPCKSVKLKIDDSGNVSKNTVERESKNISDTYVVKEGDSLWKIAKTQLNDGSKFSEIASINGISNPDKIYPGQVLKLGR